MTTAEETLKTISLRFGVHRSSLNYLVHFDPRRRVAYFETPKVACTSIKKYMQDQVLGSQQKFERKGEVHNRALSPIRQLIELSADDIRSVFFGDVKRFSFVRNPYTRVLSGYLDKIVTNQWERDRHLPLLGFEKTATPSFLEFLRALGRQPEAARDIHFAPQARLLVSGEVDYAFLGAFEKFDEDFARMKMWFYGDGSNDNYATFGKHHASGANEKVRAHFGAKEIDIVLDLYGPDFEIFEYSTDIDKSSEAPSLPAKNLRRSLDTTLVRLCLPPFNPASLEEFLQTINGAVTAGRLNGLQASDLLVRASKALPAEHARMLHRRAIEILSENRYPNRARNEQRQFDKRFS